MLGITTLPEYIQSEGAEALLDNLLKRAPVTAVATSPYVMQECSAQEGGEREPPADAGKGLARLLDRPLWGKREVWVHTAPSYAPDRSLYQGLRYQPSAPTALTESEGHVIDDYIDAAHQRGIKVYFQIQAAIPPGYRVQFGGPEEDDVPRLPDGSLPSKRLDKNGSLASPHILDYTAALISDLVQRYPKIDGLRFDWPEYPPYFVESIFLDFGSHAKAFALENGFDFETIRQVALKLYQMLSSGIGDAQLRRFIESPQAFFDDWSSCREWLRLKSDLVSNLLKRLRHTMDDSGGKGMELVANAFPYPWNHLSGFDYGQAGRHVDAIGSKYYTMHWPMMLRNYADFISGNNPGVSENLLCQAICQAFGAADPTPDSIAQLAYPEPDDRHPVDHRLISQKQRQAESAAGETPVWPMAHSYGPLEDMIARAEAAFSSKKRLWVNRYAYLSDEKLDAIGALVRGDLAAARKR